MQQTAERPRQESVQETLQDVIRLLDRHELVEDLVHRQESRHDSSKQELVEALVHRQNLAELQKKLDELHPADVAYILEGLPRARRLVVWDLVKAERDGEILLEVSDAVRESLIGSMDRQELLAAAEQLDTDEIADLAPDLPQEVVQDILDSLDAQNRSRLQSKLAHAEDSVGALMDFEMVSVRDDISLEVVLRYLRRLDALPDHTDKLFVVTRDDELKGVLPLGKVLVSDVDQRVEAVMAKDIVVFRPDQSADEAANAFERYDLVSAPVTDDSGKLIGRLTVDAVMDHIRAKADEEARKMAGLQEEEDLFASVWASAKNRWLWIAINLVTAFVASRVIGIFEGTIEKLVALAALMPIVAGIGGNSGNQTSALIVRGLALGLITPASINRLLKKEAGISLLNGVVWGSVLGVVAYLLYGNVYLGLVMGGAMLLNLLVAAVVGIFIPLQLHRMGRDPAIGSSVLLTATTDSMGFFIFLGLAALFLVK